MPFKCKVGEIKFVQITKKDNEITFDRISHAYIADETLTDTLAMAVVCSSRDKKRPCRTCSNCDKALRGIHPDIAAISKPEDKRDILVEQVRELKRDVYIMPNESAQKAYIIRDAETMNPSSQNALLQVLEEPPAHAVFILCTNNPSALLRTIRSRCVILNLQNAAEHSDFSESEYNEDGYEGEVTLARDFINALGNDDVSLMRCMFKIEKLDRAALSAFLAGVREQIIYLFKENHSETNTHEHSESGRAAMKLVSTEKLLTKAEEMLSLNVNAGHIAGMLCAELASSD